RCWNWFLHGSLGSTDFAGRSCEALILVSTPPFVVFYNRQGDGHQLRPRGKGTISPADIMAIEVVNHLCAPCSEFALAEHWYASTGLEDLLGVPDSAVTKDRLYRTLDRLLSAQEAIEGDLKERLGTLFRLDYGLVLYDLTSTYFEGLA